MPTPQRTVRVFVQGRVQGVWYRGWTVATARSLGLCGWVRNRRDGSVEAVFSGPETDVDAMLDQCRQGPPSARVQCVRFEAWNGPLSPDFRQLPSET